jgi:hypothetical protein
MTCLPLPQIAMAKGPAAVKKGSYPLLPDGTHDRVIGLRSDRPLLADQLAAAAGENRRTVAQARPLVLAALAESHLTRRLFGAMVRISGLRDRALIGVMVYSIRPRDRRDNNARGGLFRTRQARMAAAA